MKLIRRPSLLLAAAGALVTGCHDGYFVPAPTTLEPKGGYEKANEDDRVLIAQIRDMAVERTPGGVIVRATGLATEPGYWNAALVWVKAGGNASTVRLEFRVRPPVTPEPGSGERPREIHVGYALSNAELDGIRTIEVVGATNSRSSRR